MADIPTPGSTFRVVAREGDEWWGIQVRELDWVFSQAHRLHDVEEAVRDAIAAYFDVPASEVGPIVIDEVIAAGTSFSPSGIQPVAS
ncbi:hypothetical protein [Candidatus Poriferisocius sp.]|uniref:hypothetical protein n=1 Tax=Candidatus Poriferisocius sp. TaxID=3101276 RepID=UPI003B014451